MDLPILGGGIRFDPQLRGQPSNRIVLITIILAFVLQPGMLLSWDNAVPSLAPHAGRALRHIALFLLMLIGATFVSARFERTSPSSYPTAVSDQSEAQAHTQKMLRRLADDVYDLRLQLQVRDRPASDGAAKKSRSKSFVSAFNSSATPCGAASSMPAASSSEAAAFHQRCASPNVCDAHTAPAAPPPQ